MNQSAARTPGPADLMDRVTHTALDALAASDPAILKLAERELARQRSHLNLVAASSPTSPEVLVTQALGLSALTAEGYPGRRYHPGTEVIDEVEQLAVERACALYGADHANVQPLSASMANLALLFGILRPGDAVLSMELSHGGHLSHASRPASSSKHLTADYYQLGPDGTLDLDRVREQVLARRPKVLICGGSAYPRTIDFAALRAIADEVDALVLGDISHISGLVAAGRHPSPFPHCDIVTTSTYKQLRGPHGGLILRAPGSRLSAAKLDKFVFPGFQGTPDFGMIAAKAVALGAAQRPEFGAAMDRVLRFAKLFAEAFLDRGVRLVGGGTDTHMVLVDLSGGAATGHMVSAALERVGILANKNLIPGDPRSAQETSGLRIGTNHLAFLHIGDREVAELASDIAELVACLTKGTPAEQCPSWPRLTEHASALIGAVRQATPI